MKHTNHFGTLSREQSMIDRCYRCGQCRTVCPSFEESGTEDASPRGRIQAAAAMLDGRVGLDAAIEGRMLDCLTCLKCSEVCPAGVRTDRVVLAARAELVARGHLHWAKRLAFATAITRPRLMRLGAWAARIAQRLFMRPGMLAHSLVPRFMGMEDKAFPQFAGRSAAARWPRVVAPVSGPPKMRVAYFIGCATSMLFPEVADATIRVLTHNGIEVIIPRGQVCCGIPVYTSGDFATARRLARTNRAVFEGTGADCVITDCSSCSSALKHDIRQYLGEEALALPVYDLTEFLADVIELDRDFGKVPMTVTYHDPCHLARGQNIRRQPRDLLRAVPGVNFVEMRDADSCCGSAGTMAYTHHDLSRSVGARKTEALRQSGADYVATPCPACVMQLDDLINHAGLGMKTLHPVQVLDAAYRSAARDAPGPCAEIDSVRGECLTY